MQDHHYNSGGNSDPLFYKSLTLLAQYAAGSLTVSSDGHGGTTLNDRSATAFNPGDVLHANT
jgi:hypothetical protein